jgi:hypothetical protein
MTEEDARRHAEGLALSMGIAFHLVGTAEGDLTPAQLPPEDGEIVATFASRSPTFLRGVPRKMRRNNYGAGSELEPPSLAQNERVVPAEREVPQRRNRAVSKASSIRRGAAGLNPGPSVGEAMSPVNRKTLRRTTRGAVVDWWARSISMSSAIRTRQRAKRPSPVQSKAVPR